MPNYFSSKMAKVTQDAIALISQDSLMLKHMETLIINEFPNQIIKIFTNSFDALRLLENPVKWIVIDMNMKFINGIEIVYHFNKKLPQSNIIMLANLRATEAFEEINKLKLQACIIKEQYQDDIVKAIKYSYSGKSYINKLISSKIKINTEKLPKFTKTESRILNMILKGETSLEIANTLFVSVKTIESHRYNLCKKLNLKPEKNSLLKWALQNERKIKGYSL